MPRSVTILLALFDGSLHLREQLESLRAQSLQPTHIIASDDGSSDETIDIYREFMRNWPTCSSTLLEGPKQGFSANFFHLLRAPSETDYVAFCDQDDVWLPHKLETAVATLEARGAAVSIYGSRTQICDMNLRPLRLSRRMTAPFGLEHALVQSFAGGNTQVLTSGAFRIAQTAAHQIGTVAAHDWWTYQLITSVGGTVIYDEKPSVLYRQHHGSSMGDSRNRGAKRARANLVRSGTYSSWIDANIEALWACRGLLTTDACRLIQRFDEARKGSTARRLRMLFNLGIRRQGIGGQAGLYWAAATGRL